MDMVGIFGSLGGMDALVALEQKGLTPREVEVLEWVARGKTNNEIGVILQISPRTASKHLEHIYVKLGVVSRTSAVVQLLEMMQQIRQDIPINPVPHSL